MEQLRQAELYPVGVSAANRERLLDGLGDERGRVLLVQLQDRDELAHGRCEERTLWAAEALEIPWPHARQVLRLHRRLIAKASGTILSDEVTYALTSLTPEQARSIRACSGAPSISQVPSALKASP